MFSIGNCFYIILIFPPPAGCEVGGPGGPGAPEIGPTVEGDGDHGGVEAAGDQVHRAQAPLHRLEVRQ